MKCADRTGLSGPVYCLQGEAEVFSLHPVGVQ